MTKDQMLIQFITWVKNMSQKDTSNLHELVMACLDDAIENIEVPKQALTEETEKDLMKQIMDYWSSNVYMIFERGVANDHFRGIRMPISTTVKVTALKEYHRIRNRCYEKLFSF